MEMTEFNKGWWSCFISFSSEILLSRRDGDMEVITVLDGANISEEEVGFILDNNDFFNCPKLKELLETYRNTNYGNNK